MSGTVAQPGRDGALQLSTNGGSTYAVVPGVRASNPTINNNPVDITNAASPSAAREMLANGGQIDFEVSADGVIGSGAVFVAFMAHVQNRTTGRWRVNFGNGGRFEFLGGISQFSINAPHNDAQTFSCTVFATGPVTWTAPT